MRYFCEISFDGTNFCGWQTNPPHRTVQDVISKAMNTLFRKELKIVGCGRTDTGVHALSFYFHFDMENEIDTNVVVKKLRGMMPPDITIKRIIRVRDDAHARYSAKSRQYMYFIVNEPSPFLQKKALVYERILNLDFLNACCEILKNTTDFTSFRTSGSTPTSPYVKVIDVRWEKTKIIFPPVSGILNPAAEIDAYVFIIECNRFLYRMVRNIVMNMLYLERRGASIDKFKEIIERRSRVGALPPAPPYPLYLTKVTYDEGIFRIENN